MAERYLSRNVKKETRDHYKGGWPLAADARRNLYLKYAGYPPGLVRSSSEIDVASAPRDMWQEIAAIVMEYAEDTTEKKGIDVGSSSGYFIERLLEQDYRGEITGVDTETSYMPFLQDFLGEKWPQARIVLGGADAQSLRAVELGQEDAGILEIALKNNQFDFLTELFVLYHLPRPQRALNAAHRVLKPGGLAIFSGRGNNNQQNLWYLGAITANHFSATTPNSFYSHYPLDQMEHDLQASRKFNVLGKHEQDDLLWIPATDEGWMDYRIAILSLLPLMRKNGRQLSGRAVWDYLDESVRPVFFDRYAEKNNGYFVDRVHQTYFVCEAVK